MADIVRGWVDIGKLFGVSSITVKGWHQTGAPIVFLGRAPVTEAGDLWAWILENRQTLGKGRPMRKEPKVARPPERVPFQSVNEIKKAVGAEGMADFWENNVEHRATGD